MLLPWTPIMVITFSGRGLGAFNGMSRSIAVWRISSYLCQVPLGYSPICCPGITGSIVLNAEAITKRGVLFIGLGSKMDVMVTSSWSSNQILSIGWKAGIWCKLTNTLVFHCALSADLFCICSPHFWQPEFYQTLRTIWFVISWLTPSRFLYPRREPWWTSCHFHIRRAGALRSPKPHGSQSR